MTRSAAARATAAAVFAAAAVALVADAAPVPVNRGLTPPARQSPDAEPLPPGAVIRLGSNRFRVAGGVDRLSVSPDGKFVAASGMGGVTVFDAATGKPTARIRDLAFVEAQAFAADGALLVVGLREDGKHVVNRHAADGRLLGATAMAEFLAGALTLSPDGRLVVSTEGDEVKVFDTATGKPAGKALLPKDSANVVDFSADGRWLGVLTHKNRFVVFDRLTGGEVCRAQLKDPVVHFAFAPDGTRAAVAQSNSTVALIDVPSGKLARTVKAKTSAERVALTPGGDLVVYSGQGDDIRVFESKTGKLVRHIGGSGDLVQCVIFPDGATVGGGTFDGAVRLWDLKTGKRHPASAEPAGPITQLGFPTADHLVGFADGFGWLGWDTRTGAQRRVGPGVRADEMSGVSRDGKFLAVGGAKGIRVLDAATGAVVKAFPEDKGFATTAVWFAPGGKELFDWGSETLRVWDVAAAKSRDVSFTLGKGKQVVALDVSPDGTRVAGAIAGPDDGGKAVVRVLDLRTGKAVYEVAVVGEVSDVTFTPDGGRFAVFSRPPSAGIEYPSLQIALHDAATGRVVRRITGDYMEQVGIPFSPDGRVIAMAGMDNTVRLVEVASGKDRGSFEHSPYNWPDASAFSPDGLLLATAGGEVPVYVWDVRRRREPAGPVPDAAAAERLWRELGSDDAELAYRAVTTLERHPSAAVRLFRGNLSAAKPADAAAVAKWVAELDDPAYRVRVSAYRQLSRVSDRASAQLRSAAAKTSSSEVRERLTALVELSERVTPDALRMARAVEALEYAGTPDAKALLREWAGGAAEARLTAEATAAVGRLK